LPSKTSRPTPYTLVTTDDLSNITPHPATRSKLGSIIVGEGLDIDNNNGTLSIS